ncbi:MAG: HAD-IA family hydrolase [Bacilli bacterium]
MLTKEYLPKSYPLLEENFNYIKALKDKAYKLFLLTYITEDSYNYINETININSIFTGGIYSYQEHLIKPNPKNYELIIKRFNLNKSETIFFDDKEKNVKAAKETGLKSIVFTSLQDIKDNINSKN